MITVLAIIVIVTLAINAIGFGVMWAVKSIKEYRNDRPVEPTRKN